MEQVLLHCCCAPCSVYCVESLRAEEIEPVGFWYNPNIHLYEEYRMRRETMITYAQEIHMELLIQDEYGLRKFVQAVGANVEKRCVYCYSSRLNETAKMAKELGLRYFASTLFISPYQDNVLMREVALQAAKVHGVEFLDRDFAQGYRQGHTQARELGLYMQKYCGCIYSEEERYAKKIEKDRVRFGGGMR